MDITSVAELCYARGWRDKQLITMVSIIGSETGYNPEFNDRERFGLFGLRSTEENWEPLMELEHNSLVARERYVEKYFVEWLSFSTGGYLKFVKRSIEGVGSFYLTLFDV